MATLRVATARPLATVRMPSRSARTCGRLTVQANTIWQLAPHPNWAASNKKESDLLKTLDLTGAIGCKKLCSFGSEADHEKDCDAIIRTQHGGLHLVFEAEGASNPLDSPSVLFVKDIDSTMEVKVDGKKLEQGEKCRLKPGATLALGDEVQLQVQRNVFAHA